MDSAVALYGFDEDGGGFFVDGIEQGFVVVYRDAVEAVHGRTESFQMFGFACRGDERERSAVERIVKGEGSVSLRLSFGVVRAARELEHGFVGFCARVAKKDRLGEGRGFQDACAEGDLAVVLRRGNLKQARFALSVTTLYLTPCDFPPLLLFVN